MAELDPEHRPADALHHRRRIPARHRHVGPAELAHLPHLGGDRLTDGPGHVLRDRFDDGLPAGEGAVQPGPAAVHGKLGRGHVDRDHRVQPQPRHLRGLAQLGGRRLRRPRIARGAGRLGRAWDPRLAGRGPSRDVLGHVPVHGAVALCGEHALHLRGGGPQLGGVLRQIRLLRERRQVQPVQRVLGEGVPEGLLQEALQRLLVHVTGSTRDRGITHGHLQQSVGRPAYRSLLGVSGAWGTMSG